MKIKPIRISNFINSLENKVMIRLAILQKNELYQRELSADFMELVT